MPLEVFIQRNFVADFFRERRYEPIFVEIALFERGWVTLNEDFRGKGRPPPKNFGIRKLESLGYRMVKKIAENFNRLSRVHQRYRQTTDRQTDRRICDSI